MKPGMLKPGMTISCAGHAAALFFGLMAISAQPMEAPQVQTLPVSFISEKDFSQLSQGVKNTPELKIPDPKPLADKIDLPKPVDQLAPKVANKPEITTEASKPAAPSKPETKPEAKPEAATETKQAQKPADKPDKPKPAEYRPDQIANLLKKDAAKEQPKREAQRQLAAAQSVNDTTTLGASMGAPGAQLSQSEIDALRARISSCWSPPPGIDANSKLYVVLRVLFKSDGSMLQAPTVVEGTASALGPALAESAKRALLLCQPFTMLRPDHCDQWKDLELKFDPHELLGG